MNRIRHLTYALAGVAALILSVGTVPAFAERVPPPGAGDYPQQVAPAHVVVTGGMPGWQIALIAVGAALLAAALAVIADRARTAHTALRTHRLTHPRNQGTRGQAAGRAVPAFCIPYRRHEGASGRGQLRWLPMAKPGGWG